MVVKETSHHCTFALLLSIQGKHDINSMIWREREDFFKIAVFFLLFENKTEDSLLVHKFYCLIQNNSSSSGSNWILMSCQPHRVTSGQSNSGQKQISKLFLNIIYQPSLKSNYKTNHFRNIKHNAQIFKELVPSILPLLKEHYI